MKIHFIGIGGIGVSALAKYYLKKGHKISGSDLVSSEITEALKKQGAKIFIGKHKPKCSIWQIEQPDLVVYSPAVKPDNPELKEAKRLKIKTQSYPEALGELTRKYFTIAISGTHGKSTTTAMLGLLLKKAGFDPTVIVGTKVKEFKNSNCRVGKSKYLVIEADEHFGSFLNYWPKIIVLTNIEADHLDYYKNLNNILKTFQEYIKKLPQNGWLVANKDDKNTQKVLNPKLKFKLKNYSLKQPEAKKLKKSLKVPGEHNVYNALATLTVARVLKIPDKVSFKALSEYRGSWRRFEIKHTKLHKSEHKSTQITIISDYAHHPTEVKATLLAAREKFPKKNIWCIFQPHQYQRTFYLFREFVEAFSEAPIDKLIITNIYSVAGREKREIKEKVSSEKLVRAIKKRLKTQKGHNERLLAENVLYLYNFKKIRNYLKKNLKANPPRQRQRVEAAEVIIIMGAGDIYKLSEK